MMWTEFEWKGHSIAPTGKMPLEEDALAFSFRCALNEKTPFTQNASKMSRLFVVDAHQGGDGKRFVVRADEKLTAFLELESTIRAAERPEDCGARKTKLDRLPR